MRVRYLAISTAALMAMAAGALSARADDTAPTPPAATTTAAPPATTDAPPVTVPRPSIVPKTADKGAEPQAPQTTDDTPPRAHRHYARRHHWRYAAWEPFPVYWPHLYHSRIYWNRIPWFSF